MSFLKDFLTAVAVAAIGYFTGGVGWAAGAKLAFFKTMAVVLGASTYASHQQRKAARAARAAASGATVQNNIVLRTADYPEHVIYGKTRVPLILAYACMHTATEDGLPVNYATMVLALPCRHEINSIVSILAGDYDIGTLDGDGYVTAGKYFNAKTRSHSFTAEGDVSSTVYTLQHTAGEMLQSGLVDSVAFLPYLPSDGSYGETNRYSADTLTLGSDYSVVGNQVTLLRSFTNGQLIFTYRYNSGLPHVRVIRNLAGSTPHNFLDLETVSNGEWASSDELTGVPNIVVRIRWDEENTLWTGGMPEWSVIAEGKKLYDPKKDSTKSALGGSGSHRYNQPSTWEYSNRPSLCWRDYMQNRFGCTEPEIDDAAVISAEPVCDSTVAINGVGGTEKAFTCDGLISTADEHWRNIELLAVTMMGNAVCTGGVWRIVPFGWTAPVATLTTDSLVEGDVTIDSRPGVENTTNSVRGQFMDNRATQYSPNGLYVMHDFPSYKSASYINEDLGIEYWDDVEFPLTTGPWRAQRMAKFYMFRARNALMVEAPFGLDAYELQPGDRVRLPWSMNGWEGTYEGGAGKVFQVISHKYTPPYRVDMTLKEDASAYHNWSYTEAFGIDPSPNTSLPAPNFVETLQNVRVKSDSTTYYVDKSGNVVPYLEVSFDKPQQLDVYVVLYWKRAAETEYKPVRGAVGATYLRVEYVGAGETLNAYLIAHNQLGAQSDPVWIPTIVVGTDVPAPVIAVSANLLRNTNFEGGVVGNWVVAQWNNDYLPTFQRHADFNYYVAGSPSSAHLDLADPRSGAAEAVALYAKELIPVSPDKEYIGFCGLIPYGGDGSVAIAWYDKDLVYIPNANLNSATVLGSLVNPYKHWTNPNAYQIADVRGKPPASAAFAQYIIVLGGTFAAVPAKYLSIFKPFFGEIPANALGRPPWDPGVSNPVGTEQLADGATTDVYEFTSATGVSLSFGNTMFAAFNLGTFVAAASGKAEVTVTAECSGRSYGSSPAHFRTAVWQSGKYPRVDRHAVTAPANSVGYNTVTLQAVIQFSAGEVVAPQLVYSREVAGPLQATPEDRIYNIVTRVALVKK